MGPPPQLHEPGLTSMAESGASSPASAALDASASVAASVAVDASLAPSPASGDAESAASAAAASLAFVAASLASDAAESAAESMAIWSPPVSVDTSSAPSWVASAADEVEEPLPQPESASEMSPAQAREGIRKPGPFMIGHRTPKRGP
jgi:hypothetical protein